MTVLKIQNKCNCIKTVSVKGERFIWSEEKPEYKTVSVKNPKWLIYIYTFSSYFYKLFKIIYEFLETKYNYNL